MSPNETKPEPTQWTLRLKHHRATILLYADPSTPFSTIKSSLLSSIRATGLTSLPPHNTPLPSSPDDVILGLPVDKNDFSKGWVNLQIPENEDEDEGQKGETKKKYKGGVQKGSVLNASPLGAGLKDGAVIAFKFQGEAGGDGEFDVVIPTFEEEGTET